MKNTSIYLISIFLFSSTLIASSLSAEGLAGSWLFSVKQTAPEYSSGSILFEEAENHEFTGKIIFHTGREILLQSDTAEADTVTFTATVDGSLVTTVCTLKGNKLTGSVKTPDGNLPFTAMREE